MYTAFYSKFSIILTFKFYWSAHNTVRDSTNSDLLWVVHITSATNTHTVVQLGHTGSYMYDSLFHYNAYLVQYVWQLPKLFLKYSNVLIWHHLHFDGYSTVLSFMVVFISNRQLVIKVTDWPEGAAWDPDWANSYIHHVLSHLKWSESCHHLPTRRLICRHRHHSLPWTWHGKYFTLNL